MAEGSDRVRCKGVHVKLDRETHANFKIRLVQHGLSMQEAFEEFARLVGSGQPTANKMLERVIREHLKEELASVGLKPLKKSRRYLGELDPDKLYDLINDGENDDETEVPPKSGGRNETA